MLALALTLSACGGAPAAPSTGTAGATTSTPVASAASPTKAASATTPTTAASTNSADATCNLLSMSDVSMALGEPVVANNNFGCEFDSTAKSPFKVVRFLTSTTTPETFEADVKKIAGENGGLSSVAPVSGIGDAALAWHDDQGSARLDVRKGTKTVQVWVNLGVLGTKDLDAKMAIAKMLATIAAAKLA